VDFRRTVRDAGGDFAELVVGTDTGLAGLGTELLNVAVPLVVAGPCKKHRVSPGIHGLGEGLGVNCRDGGLVVGFDPLVTGDVLGGAGVVGEPQN